MIKLRLGTSTYSYWHFTKERIPVEHVLDKANELGLFGIEILHQQLESEERSYLQALKRHAFRLGLDLYNLGTSQSFIFPDPEERQRQVKHTLHCIDLAHELGIPSIRVNSGTWRREGSGSLAEARGWTKPWEGYTEDNGFHWAIDGLSACLKHAERQGVMLLLENHWGLTTTPEGMLRILETINSPWLRALLDMGNFYFTDDMYAAMEKIAPWVDLAHAKTYPGGGTVFTIDLDYRRVFRILLAAGFRGYTSLEMEGCEPAETAVPKSIAILEEAWQAVQ